MGWEVAEALGEDIASAFWNSVSIHNQDVTAPEDIVYAVEKLLAAHRPRSAFSTAAFHQDQLSPQQWVSILQAVAQDQEPDGPSPCAYRLDEVFQHLDGTDGISDKQIANLELPFVPLLCNHGHREHERTLAVHRELARDPALFVHLLCWQYRRGDGADDPEQKDASPEHRKFLADLAYHALEGWRKIPGCSDGGEIVREEFNVWAEDALQRAAEVDRKEVAESHFGALLARFAHRRSWKNWLPDCVLDFLNRPENGGLRNEFGRGVHNARGMTTRSPYDGGEQERRLAGHYRNLAARYENSHPRVSVMLISIAKVYKREARREDEQAAVGERWHP